jgi:hypothetical protein
MEGECVARMFSDRQPTEKQQAAACMRPVNHTLNYIMYIQLLHAMRVLFEEWLAAAWRLTIGDLSNAPRNHDRSMQTP